MNSTINKKKKNQERGEGKSCPLPDAKARNKEQNSYVVHYQSRSSVLALTPWCRSTKTAARKPTMPECYTENYKQQRNTEHGRNGLFWGGAHQWVI